MRAAALALVAALVACGVTGTAVGRAQTSKGTAPGGGGRSIPLPPGPRRLEE